MSSRRSVGAAAATVGTAVPAPGGDEARAKPATPIPPSLTIESSRPVAVASDGTRRPARLAQRPSARSSSPLTVRWSATFGALPVTIAFTIENICMTAGRSFFE